MIQYEDENLVELDEEQAKMFIEDNLDVDLLIDNIDLQMHEGQYNKINHLEVFLDLSNSWEDAYSENPDMLRYVREKKEHVLDSVFLFIKNKCNVSLWLEDDVDKETLASSLYEFLIYDMETYLTEFLAGYIEGNPTAFADVDTGNLNMIALEHGVNNINKDIDIDNDTFIDIVGNRYDSYAISQIIEFVDNDIITFDESIKDLFFNIVTEHKDSYYDIVTAVATSL